MIVLGLDPGIRNFGWALLVDTKVAKRGVWNPPGKGKLLASQVLAYVLPRLAELVRTGKPDVAVIEEVVWRGMRRRITMPLSHVAGGACGALAALGVPVYLLTPGMKTRGLRKPASWTEHEFDAVNLARRVHAVLNATGPSGRRKSEVKAESLTFAARRVPSLATSDELDGINPAGVRAPD